LTPLPRCGAWRFLAAFFDGTVKYIPTAMNEDELREWITPRGGEVPPQLD
jgi:hypothetical protein